jgi:hypothetical protein
MQRSNGPSSVDGGLENSTVLAPAAIDSMVLNAPDCLVNKEFHLTEIIPCSSSSLPLCSLACHLDMESFGVPIDC